MKKVLLAIGGCLATPIALRINFSSRGPIGWDVDNQLCRVVRPPLSSPLAVIDVKSFSLCVDLGEMTTSGNEGAQPTSGQINDELVASTGGLENPLAYTGVASTENQLLSGSEGLISRELPIISTDEENAVPLGKSV